MSDVSIHKGVEYNLQQIHTHNSTSSVTDCIWEVLEVGLPVFSRFIILFSIYIYRGANNKEIYHEVRILLDISD